MSDGEPAPTACVVNLGPRQARRRLLVGIGASLAAVALGVLSLRHGGTFLLGAALAATFVGALGLLQARAKT